MRITPDTNVLVRAIVGDDPGQTRLSRAALSNASLIVITVPVLCETVWVLRSSYRYQPAQIALALRTLLRPAKVAVDRAAAEAGLAMLDKGGDFADGAIAALGQQLGSDCFVTFDRRAAALLAETGIRAQLL
ncbi:MAG: type II toxin-antitoxin system VapC family toxin [Bifidobacteriaceae bacterium]|nr:type II toxin-antitoxin system VapC family toxin [Bifidobacteriaceae bacterium]